MFSRMVHSSSDIETENDSSNYTSTQVLLKLFSRALLWHTSEAFTQQVHYCPLRITLGDVFG